MKKRKEIKHPDWNKIKNRMVEYITDILQKKWQTPIILDIYEFKEILQGERKYNGVLLCLIQDGELYIDHIALRKQPEEKMVYSLAHELGHVLDFINLEFGELSCIKEIKYDVRDKKDKRVLYEREKRACSKGFDLLQQAGLSIFYLKRYLAWKQTLLCCIAVSTKQEK